MPGPAPYQPIQYPEAQVLMYVGQRTIGNAHLFSVDSNSPTQFASSTNEDVVDFWVGAAISRHPSGEGFILANNASAATAAIGLATLGAPVSRPEIVQLYGLITMDDWTPTTGTTDLVALGNYYLDAVSGHLTTTVPVGPAIAQLVGIAISPHTMEIVASGSAAAALAGTGANTFGMSNLGNTLGTTGVVTGSAVEMIFVGGNNITLSQSLNGALGTITFIGPTATFSQSVQTQNLFDLTLSGNTAGVMALVSSGTLTLAGGNNITLSQAGNAITISGPNTSSQSVQTQNCVDLSLSGNTSGALALISSGTAILAGGNNITLSQNGQSVTISAFNQSAQTQDRFDLTLSGNTSGALALISSGTMTLAGGNNITLSQAGNAVTISGPNTSAQTVQTQNLFDLTLSGNTSGTLALVSSGTLTLAGGNNVTLSQVGNAITISGPNTVAQSVQTQNCVDLSLSGNTSGTLALISSGTAILAGGNNVTLSQNGQSITISAANQTVQTQNLIDLSLSGNTSGTLALISSGTAILAGGNNITLSQNGQSVTISAFNQTVESQSIGMSNLGNTSGTTGIASGGQVRFLFAGGNNITLSQSLNGASGTITVNGPNIAVAVQTAGISNLGNTGGTSGVVTGAALQVVFAGGNNITLSQSLTGSSVTITISAFNQSVQTQNLIDLSLSGNTSGTLTLISSGTAILAGGNNITLSQNGQSITISAANAVAQSVQTQNLFDLTLSGNTSGTLALVSSGTLTLAGGNNITLSQSGNAITISAFTQTVQTQNCVDVTLAGNTTGTLALISSGTMTLAGGSNITLSQNGNAVTVSAGLVRNYWHNVDLPANNVIALSTLQLLGSMFIGPLQRDGIPFLDNMTVSTMYMGVSMSASTSAMSGANTFSVSYGLYTLNGATLSLVNSVSTSFGWAAATNASTKFAGLRMLSFHSSQWSSTPVMSLQKYWQAFGWSNQNSLATNWTIQQMGTCVAGVNSVGAGLGVAQMSGTIGVSQVADTGSTKALVFGVGILSTTALPSGIQQSQLSKSNLTQVAIIPFVMFNNVTTDF